MTTGQLLVLGFSGIIFMLFIVAWEINQLKEVIKESIKGGKQ